MGKCCVFLFLFLFSMAFVSSAHYITGFVDDAKDGELADNHIVVLWNPSVGIHDNLTDVVGVNGNAGFSNVFMIDCEMLNSPCSIGDQLRVKVIDSGDSYISNYSSVVVSTSGYTMADNITLNSLPIVSLNSPGLFGYWNKETIGINCSFEDLDSLGVLSLYGNSSGSWALIDSISSFEGNHVFSANVLEGSQSYYCEGNDGLVSKRTNNIRVIGDFTSPAINSFFLNESSICGSKMLRVGCDTSDLNGVEEVLIEVNSPLYSENYSATNVSSSNFLLDVWVEYIGEWNFVCYSRDFAGNVEKSFSRSIYSHSGYPELSISSENISFSNDSPVEGSSISMTAEVLNYGCASAENFSVSFYLGDPSGAGILIDSIRGSLLPFSSDAYSVNYNSLIGKNDIFVSLDREGIISESNKDDNINFEILNVPSWQTFYGVIDAVKILSGEKEMAFWDEYSQFEGNVFMADSESEIDWLSLVAIGMNKLGEQSQDDFFEIDELLGMGDYEDSVSFVYSLYDVRDFFIQGRNVSSVPVIQSTNNSNFFTGILWDSSDSVDLEFDYFEKEDLVFISNINKNSQGKHGVYDYEITIPAKLREYDPSDYTDVYFYYELI